jgi:hypothetical protein
MPTNILEVPLCIPSVFPLWILCVTLWILCVTLCLNLFLILTSSFP